MSNTEFTKELSEEYGISQDFLDLALAGEAVITALEALYEGKDIPAEMIDPIVEFLGTMVGLITVKYDPALQSRREAAEKTRRPSGYSFTRKS